MMRSKTILILLACLFAAACQKRKYPDEKVRPETEDIYFSGDIGGEQITLRAGTEGYYCYSSYEQRTDSIYVFEGALRKYDCNPCSRALKVELADYIQRAPGAPVNVDSSLRMGNRHFIPTIVKPVTIRFAARSNKEISSLRWDLGNGTSSQDPELSCEFGQPGQQTVSLTVRTKGNCESMVVNKIFVGDESSLFACGISARTPQNNNAEFTANIIGGKPPYKYTWNFGDGSTSDLPAPLHSYKWAGSYPVKLMIEDAGHHLCESNYIHVTGSDNSSCSANMTLSYAGSRNAFLNGVKLQWTDQSQVTFRSDNIAQPSASYFEVMNSQDYEPNERGEKGRLLTLRFNVLLSDGSRKIWFKSENTAIAVTYK